MHVGALSTFTMPMKILEILRFVFYVELFKEYERRSPMKITKKYLEKLIKEELQKIITEKNGYGAIMHQEMVDQSPEVIDLKPKLSGIPGVEQVYYDNIEDSKQPGYKLISTVFKVKAISQPASTGRE